MKKVTALITVATAIFLILLILAGCPSSLMNKPPTVTKVRGPSGTIDESSSTFKWSGNDPDGSIDHYEYRKDGGSWNTTTGISYNWSGYSEGSHTFELKAKDNEGAYSNTISWSFTYSPFSSDYSLTVTTTPDAGLEVQIGGTNYTSPKTMSFEKGETVNIGVTSPQEKDKSIYVTGTDTRYTFKQWNDGNTNKTRTITINNDITYTAEMEKEYKIETATSPEGLAIISGTGWYEADINKDFEAPSVENYSFSYWLINDVNCGSSNPIKVTVDNPKSLVAKYVETNIPPEINIPDQETTENSTLTLDLSNYASDTDGDVLSFEKLSGVGVVEGSVFTYSPGFEDSGIYDVTIRVKDTHDASDQDTFKITVQNLNRKPEFKMLSPENGLTNLPTSTILKWEAEDPDGDELKYDCYFGISEPLNLVLENSTNTQYEPSPLIHNTKYYWKLEASDGEATISSDLRDFTVTEEKYSDFSLSIIDDVLYSGTSNSIFIHAENISNVLGIQVVILYDETKLSTPSVTKLNSVSDFMGPIVKKLEPGKLLISVAGNESVSLSEKIFRIDFEVIGSRCTTRILFDNETEVVNDELNVIPVDISDEGIFWIE